jgi:toxin-antitoxin system PIN domain toxin
MHKTARQWIDTQLSSVTPIGLPWLAIIAFLSLTTQPKIFPAPFTGEQAIEIVNRWLVLPNVTPLEPGPQHWQTLSRLFLRSGMAGNLTSDAHLAAIDNPCLVCSADSDFKRFQGVQHFNPLDEEAGDVHEPMLHYKFRQGY